MPGLARLAAIAPSVAFREAARGARRRIGQILPRPVRDRLPRLFGDVPAPGRVRLGDLDGIMPIGRDFGFDRGTPIDRYYIERFLERHASEIGGRVLEVGGDDYTRRFGGTRVTHSDVLHVHPGNPRATIVGDLTDPSVLPEGAFDCIVLTQTLQLIYDVRLALAALHRALAPGGVLLVTVPGISQIDRGEWGDTWFWSFTPAALTRLFAESFGRRDVADFAVSADVADLADVADRADAAARVDHADDLIVEHHGNVFAATAFLQGLAVEEVDVRKLDHLDRAYPVIVAARARKKRG